MSETAETISPPEWLMTPEQQGEAILVYEARALGGPPLEWMREISCNGGDEDRFAVVSAAQDADWFGWLEEGGPFGCCCVEEHVLTDGRHVFIGCHA
jgi:hypothetical protein